MTPIAIRRASAGDAAALTQLMQNSTAYQGAYRSIVEGYAVTPAQIDRDELYVAEADGALIGFYSLIVEPPELDLMFVADHGQGRGVGRALFEHMIGVAAAKGIEAVRIVSHPPALAFYQRMGAERVGTKEISGRVSWGRPILKFAVRARQTA